MLDHLRSVNCLLVLVICCLPSSSQAQDRVPAANPRAIDDEVGFAILVWQFQTDVIRDSTLYESVGLSGFHIDRGQGQQSIADWAVEQNWPYYIDHAAGKGILHLTNRSGLDEIPRDGTPARRPFSLPEVSTLDALKEQLDANLPDAISHQTLAVALDDEVSIGTFNSPLELDYTPESIEHFQAWIDRQYNDSNSKQHAWSEQHETEYQYLPKPYEWVRTQLIERPPAEWRLAPWMDFRTFNDHQFAGLIASATQHAAQLSEGAPVGFVGAQQPSAYGGFDYSKLRHSIQFIEAYDIGGTNEILQSFWSDAPRKPRMQTYFASGNLSADKWFLWYYLAHGNRGVIVWPTVNGEPWFVDGELHPHVQSLAETFSQVQSTKLTPLTHPNTTPIFDRIAVLVSQPSVRLGWAIDASTHGRTWPRRSSSLDNSCNSSGKNRVAWTRLLEDLGYQARLVDEAEMNSGVLDEMSAQVLVLPQALAIDSQTCTIIKQFAENGGMVVADYLPAITDEHGTGFETSPLAELFGVAETISRTDPWFDGRRRFEIDGERYNQPFLNRISDDGCIMLDGQSVIHRDLGENWIQNTFGNGLGVLINQSPTRLFVPQMRHGEVGRTWRARLTSLFQSHGLASEIETEITRPEMDSGVECLRYQLPNSADQIWCWVRNPTRQASVNASGELDSTQQSAIGLSVSPVDRVRSQINRLVDLRRGDEIPLRFPLELSLPADEAIIIKVEMNP